ncbi:MAG: hypothetical protein ACKO6N_14790 [Myxococcota bacterium]
MSTRTFWHPPAVTLIEVALPEQYVLYTEFSLRRLPQRIDLLVIRRAAQPEDGEPFLPALLSQLTDVTLLEFKGGTDEVYAEDVSTLLGYACQYEQHWRAEVRREQKRRRKGGVQVEGVSGESGPQQESEQPLMSMGFIAPRLTQDFKRGLRVWGGELAVLRPGLWKGVLAGHPLFFIETEVIWEGYPEDRLFYVLTKKFLREGLSTEGMTEEERSVYNKVEHWFTRVLKEQKMTFRQDKIREIQEENRRFREEFIQELTPEERVKGLPAEELLKVLPAEELLKGLPAEERVKGLPAEELLKGLPAEERVKGLPAEERVKGLPAEERVKGLPAEELLRAFTPEQRKVLERAFRAAS